MPLSNQSDAKLKPIVTWSHAFTCVWLRLHVFALSSDRFLLLFSSFVIGQSDYFGFGLLHSIKLKTALFRMVTYFYTDLHQVTTALDNRRREEKESLDPVMRQLESQTQSFQAMTERLSSNIMADFEVMLQKQLASSIEG